MNKENPREVYADIIDLPHHQSKTRPHMSLYDRAAQFSPFAALSGYDNMVLEEARLTDRKRELPESELELLNQKMSLIMDLIEEKQYPEITVKYFVPDRRKAGGRYEEEIGTVKRIDPVEGCVVFFAPNMISDGRIVSLNMIAEIHGSQIDYMED